jgi:Ca2+-binding RTX toxin-like protein
MSRSRSRHACPIAFWIVLLLAGATPAIAATTEVHVVGSLETVQPAAAPTGPAADNPAVGAPTVHLRAARNEFESFQIVVRNNGAAPLGGVDVSTKGPLVGPGGATIPASDITIYREGYYTVYTPSDHEDWEQYGVPYDQEGFNTAWKCTEQTVGPTYPLPCEFPDALIPKKDYFYGETRNAFPTSVPAGQNRVAWIDILVPAGTPIGEYSGELTVSGEGLTQAIGVDVDVFNFEVPSTPTLEGGWDITPNRPCAVQGGCPSSEAGFALNSLYDRAALENRVGITHPSYADPTGNPAVAGSNAALFRRYVLPLLQGNSPQDPGGLLTPLRLSGARIRNVFLNQFSATNAEAWKTEAENGGFVDRVRFYCDELGEDLARWTSECNGPYETAATKWGAGLKAVFTGNIGSLEYARAHGLPVASAIDTLIPVIDQIQTRSGENHRDGYDGFLATAGHHLWLYQSCDSLGCSGGYTPPDDYSAAPYWDGWPSLGIDQPASEARAMDWQVFNFKASGQYYYEVARGLPVAWQSCASAPTNCLYIEGGNGDGTLFYPGTPAAIGGTHEIPIESIRLKRYRDGEEDYELLRYLADELGKEAEVREIAGGPYAPGPGQGLFKKANESNVSSASLESARDELIALLPGGSDHPPALDPVGDRSVIVGETLSITLSGSDPDGDSLTYSASHLPVDATFSSGTQTFNWTPTAADVGVHEVHFTVSDGQLEASEEISIAVGAAGQTCDGLAATISGTPADDHLTGTAGDDVIAGGGGDDTIDGGGGDDTICGDEGFDTIEGGPGNDLLDGGAGEDGVEYGRSSGPVTVDLRDGLATGGGGEDRLVSFTEVYGSPFDDTLIGSDANLPGPHGWSEYLAGRGGDDLIEGGGGPDLLSGGEGEDTIDGGAGEDTIEGGPDHDRIEARDGAVDQVACGEGGGAVEADPQDDVASDCESIDRGSSARPTPVTPAPSGGQGNSGRSPSSATARAHVSRRPPHRITTTKPKVRVGFSFFSDLRGTPFRCRIDSRPAHRCVSPFHAWVGPGTHHFKVWTTGSSGDDQAAEVTFAVKLQRSRPAGER